MTIYLRTSEVIGLPVVSIAGGEDVAEVRDVVYAGESGNLLGFTLNKRGFLKGRMREVLPAESVFAIGSAAVMIANEQQCLVAASDAPEEVGAPETNRNVLGNTVITDGGVKLGTVTDLGSVERGFELGGWHVVAVTVETLVVELMRVILSRSSSRGVVFEAVE